MNHTLRTLLNQLPEAERDELLEERSRFSTDLKAVSAFDKELEERLLAMKHLREVAKVSPHDQPHRKRVERMQIR